MAEPFTIALMPDRQELIYLPGDGSAITLGDGTCVPNLPEVSRAVLVARLRAWADLLSEDVTS